MLHIELKNYRAFPDSSPARWTLDDGFTSFIGVNNAGKSSLLRFFHEMRPLLAQIGPVATGNFHNAFQNPEGFHIQSVGDQSEIFSNLNSRNMTITFRIDPSPEHESGPVPSALEIEVFRDRSRYVPRLSAEGNVVPFVGWHEDGPILNVAGENTRFDLGPYQRAIGALADSVYLGPFRNAINVGTRSDYFDLQIGEAFIAQWDAYKTGGSKDNARSALAVEQEIGRIFGMASFQMNATPNNQALQLIVDSEPYQLHEQGAGLAQFILVLAFVAVRKPEFVLIDEPELNLHPALQLDFLTTLSQYAGRGVVFATHSLGLARAASDRIYTVRRVAAGHSDLRELEATPRLIEFVGELGYSGYRELGFDRLLLCEGPTDVKTVQRLLRHYKVEHEVLVVPLGGSSLINGDGVEQVQELTRITDRIWVLIDSEKEAEAAELEAQRAAFVDGCRAADVTVHVLSRRALENYFPEAAIQAIKGDKYRALGPFERLRDIDPAWGKRENWKIAGAMLRGDLDGTDLGKFLETLAASQESSFMPASVADKPTAAR